MLNAQQAKDPAFIDALLLSLTEQRNAALNETVILTASNKQLVSILKDRDKQVETQSLEIAKLKHEIESLVAEKTADNT